IPGNSSYMIAAVLVVSVFPVGYIQLRKYDYPHEKIENPLYVLSSSWITPESQPVLFTMKISAEAKKTIDDLHAAEVYKKVEGMDSISNIVLFVFESTSADVVQVYD